MYEALPEMPLGFSDAFLFALFKLTFENTSRVPSVSYLLTYLLTLLTLLTYSVTIHTYNTSGAHSSFFLFFFLFHRNFLFLLFFFFLLLHCCILLSSVPSYHTIPSDVDLILSLSFSLIALLFP